jgi:hypothetical protein
MLQYLSKRDKDLAILVVKGKSYEEYLALYEEFLREVKNRRPKVRKEFSYQLVTLGKEQVFKMMLLTFEICKEFNLIKEYKETLHELSDEEVFSYYEEYQKLLHKNFRYMRYDQLNKPSIQRAARKATMLQKERSLK